MSKRMMPVFTAVVILGILLGPAGCQYFKKAAQKGDTVKVDYTGKLEDGTIFDSSKDRDPLEFTLGQAQIIPGFEEAVIGMKTGQSKTVTIPVDKAYGPPRPELIQTIDKSKLNGIEGLQIGQRVRITQPNGQPISVLVTAITDKTVTLDVNHPLSGKTLIFEIKLVEISKKEK